MPDYLEETLKIYPEKPAMAFWRACEIKAVRKILDKTKLQKPSIDIGCGDGKIAKIIFENGEIDVGLDIAYLQVLAARKVNLYKRLIISDIVDTRLPDNHFRFVFSNSVIEHFPDLDAALSEISRVTANGGLLLVTVPNNNLIKNTFFSRILRKMDSVGLADSYGKLRNKRLGHPYSKSVEEWARTLSSFGFKPLIKKTYLSPKTTAVWDVLAYFDFLLRLSRLDSLIKILPEPIKRLCVEFWGPLLRGVYKKDLEISKNRGSCVAILAQKS